MLRLLASTADFLATDDSLMTAGHSPTNLPDWMVPQLADYLQVDRHTIVCMCENGILDWYDGQHWGVSQTSANYTRIGRTVKARRCSMARNAPTLG